MWARKTFYFPAKLYVYRDLNWSNIFYDESADTIIFIDAGTLHWCLDDQGGPSQNFNFALYDFQIAFYMLAHFFTQSASIEELVMLTEAYSLTYCKNIHQEDNEAFKTFLKIFTLITFIDNIFESTNDDSSTTLSPEYKSQINEKKDRELSEKTIQNLQSYLNQLKDQMNCKF